MRHLTRFPVRAPGSPHVPKDIKSKGMIWGVTTRDAGRAGESEADKKRGIEAWKRMHAASRTRHRSSSISQPRLRFPPGEEETSPHAIYSRRTSRCKYIPTPPLPIGNRDRRSFRDGVIRCDSSYRDSVKSNVEKYAYARDRAHSLARIRTHSRRIAE